MTRSTAYRDRTVLVTGATGYIGGHLVPVLLARGYRVRVLSRHPDAVAARAWGGQVETVQGDATDGPSLRRATEGVDVAYYLLHSMDGQGDFRERDARMVREFVAAAREAGVARIVYLSGLHPEGELSPHLASRVEVGRILLESGVDTAVLQAAVVIGDGSASFDMLRYLTTRLPAMVAPVWVRNRVQPIAVRDVLHYLAGAADLDPGINRTFDIGGPDVLTFAEMMQQFAQVAGLRRRLVVTVPVLTPGLASHWVGLVTPLDAGLAKPLVGSLVHEVVVRERDLDALVGPPPGGTVGYRRAVAEALREADPDPHRWGPTAIGAAGLVVGAVGGMALVRAVSAARRVS